MASVSEVGTLQDSAFVLRWPPFPGAGWLDKFVIPGLINMPESRGIKVRSAAYWSPDGYIEAQKSGQLFFKPPAEYAAGRGKPWVLLVRWERLSTSVGGGIEAGTTEGIVKAIATVALAGLGYMTFRAFTKSAGEVANAAERTIFNPGFVVAAVIIAVLLLRR